MSSIRMAFFCGCTIFNFFPAVISYLNLMKGSKEFRNESQARKKQRFLKTKPCREVKSVFMAPSAGQILSLLGKHIVTSVSICWLFLSLHLRNCSSQLTLITHNSMLQSKHVIIPILSLYVILFFICIVVESEISKIPKLTTCKSLTIKVLFLFCRYDALKKIKENALYQS